MHGLLRMRFSTGKLPPHPDTQGRATLLRAMHMMTPPEAGQPTITAVDMTGSMPYQRIHTTSTQVPWSVKIRSGRCTTRDCITMEPFTVGSIRAGPMRRYGEGVCIAPSSFHLFNVESRKAASLLPRPCCLFYKLSHYTHTVINCSSIV